ncbi:MAG TPA: AAA family ATPase, partial [Acidimicrobiales bacterium]|nr:AAA family ATPase [Acidimicrobiales bacterium]
MHLKTLTIKGFKSFADTTTLELEPGVTVVVGPNGSGKSNIVDAVAWVLGAQGTKTVRAGKMEDVIFAGTSKRPALGRAEVQLTIDNSSGILPIEFAEVTISRTLFRNGDSEYAINGVPCRLLDVQELLSDSGVGRQQHVIIGQGQLDQILNARPEDRRMVIEEAAGVLKYRKRRERAQRRLEATEGNLLRLQDLLAELRRQAKPLERQAEAARRHDGLVEEARRLRLYLAGQELSDLAGRLETTSLRKAALAAAEESAVGALGRLLEQVTAVEAATSPQAGDDLSDAVVRMAGLRERARGLAALLAERHRSLERQLAGFGDDGLAGGLAADAQGLRSSLEAVQAELSQLASREREVSTVEAAVAEERSAFEQHWRDVRSRPAAAAEVRGQLTALRRNIEGAGAAISRLESTRDDLHHRAGELDEQLATAEAEATTARRSREAAERDLGSARTRCSRAQEATRGEEGRVESARQRAHACVARAEALDRALAEAGAGADHAVGLEGTLGRLGDLVEVDPGWEGAWEAALGDAASAVAVDGVDAARRALAQLSAAGTPGMVIAIDAPSLSGGPFYDAASLGGELVRGHVRSSSAGVEQVLDALLQRTVALDGWQAALDVALAHPELVAVTRQGDRFGPTGWRIGAGRRSMMLALGEARREAEEAAGALEDTERRLAEARRDLEAAEQLFATLAARMADHDARLGDASATLDRLRSDQRQVQAELRAVRAHLGQEVQRKADEEDRVARLEADL